VKPHMGRIERWYKLPCTNSGLGYIICGHLIDRDGYRGNEGHTSYVVSRCQACGEIETRNSRYTLVGLEIEP
jgi:hypothetical protein